MYTLEEYLEENKVTEFEVLYSAWILNKKQIALAQSAISFNFPHYSLHEKSHSDTIIKNIEAFLGESRIRNLSPTDTWLLLMAAHTHDLGMVIFNSALEKEIIGKDFREHLQKIIDKSVDTDLRNAAKLLVDIENSVTEDSVTRLKVPIVIRKSLILLMADFFRKNHHERSREIIIGDDEEFNKLLNGLNLSHLPNRFATVLGEIAFAHGINFYSVIKRLEYQSNGFGSDKMHPRFIAYMLRLGDLLDVDDKRFNVFNEKILDTNLPHTSEIHRLKHASVKHLLVSPESIEVTVDCQSDEIYRTARDWFDWLQEEVMLQSREWSNIVPKSLQGMPPAIPDGKLKVLYRSVEPNKALMNLKFEISNEKIFEMLEGSALYEYPGYVFLRELIQNALDASKIQLWKTIYEGYYDFSLKQHLGLSQEISHNDLLSSIKFPNDIPDELYKLLIIDVDINWNTSNNGLLDITVKDRGTGISEMDLVRMTHRVGQSRSEDLHYNSFKETIPYWLKPTGAFGIGLQSLFLVTDSFTIQTKSDNEQAKEIVFKSSKRKEYCRITDKIPNIDRGSIVSLSLNKNDFQRLFSGSFEMSILDEYDYFNDEMGDIYIYKFRNYILKEFDKINLININLIGKNIIKSPLLDKSGDSSDFIKIDSVKDDELSCELWADSSVRVLLVNEKFVIGSSLRLDFINRFKKELELGDRTTYVRPEKEKYYVRGIPTNEAIPSFYKTSYSRLAWDLESPASDRILNLSRDKLIAHTKSHYDSVFLNTILPACVKNFILLVERKFGSTINNNEALSIEYFHAEITAKLCGLGINSLSNLYSEFELPKVIATYADLTPIKLLDFFQQTKFYFVSKKYNNPEDAKTELLRDVWIRTKQTNNLLGVVLWDQNYFFSYFMLTDFIITKINQTVEHNGTIHIQTIESKKPLSTIVEVDTASKEAILNHNSLEYYRKQRILITPIQPYELLAVKNDALEWFQESRKYTKHSIISPFAVYQNMMETHQALKDKFGEAEALLIEDIERNYLSKLVPERLINFVIKNNSSLSQELITVETVKKTYAKLILAIIKLVPAGG